MSKFIRYEGDSYSKLRQMMSRAGDKPSGVRIELATVVESPPELKIRRDSDQLILEKEELVVAEHLTRHSRIVTIEHTELAQRQLGDGVQPDHLHTDDLQLPITYYRDNYVWMRFEDLLLVGDRVLLACDDDNMVYYVLDRAVWYE